MRNKWHGPQYISFYPQIILFNAPLRGTTANSKKSFYLASVRVSPRGSVAKIKKMELEAITYKINGAVFEVNRQLGSGFLEKVYENALLIELREMGLTAESQVPVKVKYKGNYVGE